MPRHAKRYIFFRQGLNPVNNFVGGGAGPEPAAAAVTSAPAAAAAEAPAQRGGVPQRMHRRWLLCGR